MTSSTTVASLWNKLKAAALSLTVIALAVLSGCKPTDISTSAEDYYEDLTAFRALPQVDSTRLPEPVNIYPIASGNLSDVPPPPLEALELDATERLHHYIDTMAYLNGKKKFLQGYTVQVYTGLDRDMAYKAKEMVYKVLPEADPEISYEQPVYKVKVGWYRDKLIAERTYLTLKEQIPNTIVIPDRLSK